VNLDSFPKYSVPAKVFKTGVRLHFGLHCVKREAYEPSHAASGASTQEFPHG
jgi:hypothetical protein